MAAQNFSLSENIILKNNIINVINRTQSKISYPYFFTKNHWLYVSVQIHTAKIKNNVF